MRAIRRELRSRAGAIAGALTVRAAAFAAVLLTSLAGPPAMLHAGDKGGPKSRPADVPPELRRIAEGYLKNRAAFASFRCEFTLRVGQAANLQEALKSGPTIQPLTASCVWMLDGNSICLRREIDDCAKVALARSKSNPTDMVLNGRPAFVAEIPLDSLGYMTDGRRALRYDPDFVANIMGPNRIEELIEGLCPDATPWALGGLGRTLKSSPGRWILTGQLGDWQCAGTERADGRTLEAVDCRREESTTRYWFDTGRGFLPVRRERRLSDGRQSRIAVTDVRKCSGGRWFPARTVCVDTRANGQVWRVQEVTVTALDADGKVKKEDLFLSLRKGIQVVHVDDMRSAFRLGEAERLGIGDLEALHERCQEVLERKARQ